MSRLRIALNPDLLRLQNEGYDLEVRNSLLLIRSIPYVNAAAQVRHDGVLFCPLELAGDLTQQPQNHTAFWIGEHPCHHTGRKITAIENASPPQDFEGDVRSSFMFSAKAEYRDYYHKMTTYIGRISGEATVLDPNASPKTFPAISEEAGESAFKYVDTASTRAGISQLNSLFANQKIGIIGTGGTGAYILDLVSKTPVEEIHLFDADVFSQHNAFRAPGAPSIETLRGRPKKVTYLASIYENIRNGLTPHDVFLDENNLSLLDELTFVFLCMDHGKIKRAVVDYLVRHGKPFIEVGMGVVLDGSLRGIVRTSISTAENRALASPHISFTDDDGIANEYASNIQIADLNALNASIAVIQWKKFIGFYSDTRGAHYCGYSIASGEIVVEGKL